MIGVSNKLILENLASVLKSEKPVLVRMPLIPTVNDGRDNLEATGAFLTGHRPGVRMEVLPYHRLGVSKYARLGRSYGMEDIAPPEYPRPARILPSHAFQLAQVLKMQVGALEGAD